MAIGDKVDTIASCSVLSNVILLHSIRKGSFIRSISLGNDDSIVSLDMDSESTFYSLHSSSFSQVELLFLSLFQVLSTSFHSTEHFLLANFFLFHLLFVFLGFQRIIEIFSGPLCSPLAVRNVWDTTQHHAPIKKEFFASVVVSAAQMLQAIQVNSVQE